MRSIKSLAFELRDELLHGDGQGLVELEFHGVLRFAHRGLVELHHGGMTTDLVFERHQQRAAVQLPDVDVRLVVGELRVGARRRSGVFG